MQKHFNYSLKLHIMPRNIRFHGIILFYFTMVLILIHLQLSNATQVVYDQKEDTMEEKKAPAFVKHRPLSEMRTLLGSSPPRCVKRCGSCTPCKSTVVPIHINVEGSFTPSKSESEYYPVAWRCQCGGKIYYPH
eukprot:c824_g1_i1 orf=362-763(+)